MSIADKLATVAENMQKVYDAGKAAGGGVDEKYIIEKTITGKGVVYADDLSEYTHDVGVRLSSDTITDFSGVTLTRTGKNILKRPYYYASRTLNGVTFTVNDDGSITLTGTATKDASFYFTDYNNYDGWRAELRAPAVVSGSPYGAYDAGAYMNVSFRKKGSTSTSYAGEYGDGMVLPAGATKINIVVSTMAGFTFNGLTFHPMVEYGAVCATGYEPYIEAATYTANADGTVDGVESISPCMTLTADADVDITANYHMSYGAKMAYDAFWDAYQNRGIPFVYYYTFAGYKWTDKTFKPKYDIVPHTGNAGQYIFYYSYITEIPVTVDLRKCTNISHTFNYAKFLKTIKLLKTSETSGYTVNTFNGCAALENITIEGVIAQNTSFSSSTLLTHDSLMSIINALKDGASNTLTLGSANLAKLTDAEKAIATQKGWTLA